MKPIKEDVISIRDIAYREVWHRICAGAIPGKLSESWPDVKQKIYFEVRDKIWKIRTI